MKIGIDLRCLEEKRISGVGEYALELVRHILETDQKKDYLIFSNSFKKKNYNFSFLEKYPRAKLKRLSFPNKLLNFSLWWFVWPKIDRLIGGVDVFFAPNINFLAISKKCRFIAAFHDLSFERFSEFFSLKTRLWHYFFVNPRQIAKKADCIIAVSKSTKKDLEDIYGVSGEKIKVIFHGIGEDFRRIDPEDPLLEKIREKYALPQEFILYLGNIEPRKNILSLISAYKILKSKNPRFENCKLVLVGNISPLYKKIIEKEKRERNVVICGYIDRQDRPFLYNLASLFVYPSFFEGFGLPPLEAMACGTPVVTSQNSSIPEVVGGAAVLIDPGRPQQISEAMESVLTNQKFCDNLKKRGIAQAQKFSWKKCAQASLEIFDDSANT